MATPAKATPPAASGDGLTPEQQRIKELEDLLARETEARRDAEDKKKEREEREEDARYAPTGPSKEDRTEPGVKPGNILINFIEDGWSALGKVWVRGQELEFDPNSPAYEETKDRNGKSWVEMSTDEQYDTFGKVFFRQGPWKGKSLAQSKFEKLRAMAEDEGFDLPTTAELVNAERKSRAAGRTPPRLDS